MARRYNRYDNELAGTFAEGVASGITAFSENRLEDQMRKRQQEEELKQQQVRDATNISDEAMNENRSKIDDLALQGIRKVTEDTVVPEGSQTYDLSMGQFYKPPAPNINEAVSRFLDPTDSTGGAGMGRKDFKIAGQTPEGLKFSFDPIAQAAEERAKGKAEAGAGAKADKKQIETDNLTDRAAGSLANIDQIKTGLKHFGKSAIVPFIPGTERADWKNQLDQFLSTLVLDVMSDLKRASTTGSTGFGQLSEKELILLFNAATALKSTTTEEEAKQLLGVFEEKFETKIKRLQKGITGDDVTALENGQAPGQPVQDAPVQQQQQAPVQGQQGGLKVGAVEEGFVYIGGDPADPNSWTEAR